MFEVTMSAIYVYRYYGLYLTEEVICLGLKKKNRRNLTTIHS